VVENMNRDADVKEDVGAKLAQIPTRKRKNTDCIYTRMSPFLAKLGYK